MSPWPRKKDPEKVDDPLEIKEEIAPKEESKVEPKKQAEERPASEVVTLMTPLDSYISESIKTQPEVEKLDVEVKKDIEGRHRLSLPDYLEPFSYDCTQGIKCPHHKWTSEYLPMGENKKIRQWRQTKFGQFVFRWILKHKSAIDHAKHIRGWYLVNRTYFPDSPKTLFSINGAVEIGDNILFLIPFKKALEMRKRPARQSQERIKSETTRHKENPSFYEPKLSPESGSEEGVELDTGTFA